MNFVVNFGVKINFATIAGMSWPFEKADNGIDSIID